MTVLARRAVAAAAVAAACGSPASSSRRLCGALRWRGAQDGVSQAAGIPEFPELASSKANPIPLPRIRDSPLMTC